MSQDKFQEDAHFTLEQISKIREYAIINNLLVENAMDFYKEHTIAIDMILNILDPTSLTILKAAEELNEVFSPSDLLIMRWGDLLEEDLINIPNYSEEDFSHFNKWMVTTMYERDPERAVLSIMGTFLTSKEMEESDDTDENGACDCDGTSCERCG